MKLLLRHQRAAGRCKAAGAVISYPLGAVYRTNSVGYTGRARYSAFECRIFSEQEWYRRGK